MLALYLLDAPSSTPWMPCILGTPLIYYAFAAFIVFAAFNLIPLTLLHFSFDAFDALRTKTYLKASKPNKNPKKRTLRFETYTTLL